MPHVEFIKLDKPEKARFLCELAEEFFSTGSRVLIVVADDNQGVTLDRFIWTWKKGSFIPHAYDNGAVECIDEPVVISIHEENPNGSDVLIMGKPCSLAFMRRFRSVIDFAELFADDLADASRARFAEYRGAGLEPRLRQ
ncbi:MAG: DNA polymerase III subunit chi [Desulfuromonas sp.]|nr:MAG: DNA polymerase III subunit chi [Desulfuromonas sp.]